MLCPSLVHVKDPSTLPMSGMCGSCLFLDGRHAYSLRELIFYENNKHGISENVMLFYGQMYLDIANKFIQRTNKRQTEERDRQRHSLKLQRMDGCLMTSLARYMFFCNK